MNASSVKDRTRQAEERRAFEADYRLHAPGLYRFCLSRLRDEARANDFVQEVFEQAWKQRARVDFSSRPISPWLYGVARNMLSGQLRESVRCQLAVNSLGHLLRAYTEGPDEELARRDLARELLCSLDSLPEGQRQVVGLCLLGGCSYEAAATALAVPIGTVRSRLNRARLSLALAIRAASEP